MSNDVTHHAFELIKWILSPEVLSQIGIYIGIGSSMIAFGTKSFKKLWNNLEQKQNEEIDSIKKSVESLAVTVGEMRKTQERDFLRLQIITGIQSERLSTNEVLALYDQYAQKGYNSYISRIVNDYVEENKSRKGKL